MFRSRFLAGLLGLSLTMGCKAQPAPTTSTMDTNRRIEVLVRSKYDVPQDYSVTLGERKPSDIPGYDAMAITFARGAKTTTLDFLLSKDGTRLARLSTYDLENDPAFSIDTAGRPIRGNPQAKVTVISFDDLECPYCARMHETLFPSTLEHYGGKVRFVYKDDPLTDLHPWAMHAAVDANCLAAQSGEVYWRYVDYLHAHGGDVTGPDRDPKKSFDMLDRIAREQGTLGKVDAARLNACLTAQDETQVRASAKQADELGVEGTPALFVDGERIDGALPEEQVWQVIDRALRAAGEEPPAASGADSSKGTGQ
ncbi:MAG TPA: thioredoxin domain-containing protein [Terracidiphilus sp.]|nr:thioredoxin domain-containing protein [Terracidiphilus sp.]